MSGILEYSTTPSSNTTINGIGISGSSSIKYGDDAIRQFMADVRSAVTKASDKAAGTHMATKADHNQLWRVTGNATINLTSAATLTAGWSLWVMADGGTATIDPASSEQINGAATLTIQDGAAAFIICTATAFRAVIFNAPFDTGTLGQAAFLDVGTTAGTVAAGDDSRFLGVRGHIHGLTLSNNVTDAVNDIDIAVGQCASDDAVMMTLGATLTKRLDAAWEVGTGKGGLDTGSVADSTYHVWLIRNPDTEVVDALFSASATAPTLPSGYTQKRRLGAIIRKSGVILGFTQFGDTFYLKETLTDVASSGQDTVLTARTLTLPTGLVVEAIVSGNWYNANALLSVVSPGSASRPNTAYSNSSHSSFYTRVLTNTTAQIATVSSAAPSSQSLRIDTHGWVDYRGRLV